MILKISVSPNPNERSKDYQK